MEETNLRKIQGKLDMYENNLKELENVDLSAGAKNEEIDGKIQ